MTKLFALFNSEPEVRESAGQAFGTLYKVFLVSFSILPIVSESFKLLKL